MGLFSKKKDLEYFRKEIEKLRQKSTDPVKIDRVYEEAIASQDCQADSYGYASLVLEYVRNKEIYHKDNMLALCDRVIEMMEKEPASFERDSRLFEAMCSKARIYRDEPDDVNAEKCLRSCLDMYDDSSVKPSYQNWVLTLYLELGRLLFEQNRDQDASDVINRGIVTYSPSVADAGSLASLGLLYDKALLFDSNVERAKKGVEVLESFLSSNKDCDNRELRGSLAHLLSRIAWVGKSEDSARASLQYAEPLLKENEYDMIRPVVLSYHVLGEDEAGARYLGEELRQLLEADTDPEIINRTEDLAYEVFIPVFRIVGILKKSGENNIGPWLRMSSDLFHFLRDGLWWDSIEFAECGDRKLQDVICEWYGDLEVD